MKKILIISASVIALTLAGCTKERYCKCTLDDVVTAHEPVMVVAGGMQCDAITEMSIEEKYTTEDGIHSLRRVEVHQVHCREQNR